MKYSSFKYKISCVSTPVVNKEKEKEMKRKDTHKCIKDRLGYAGTMAGYMLWTNMYTKKYVYKKYIYIKEIGELDWEKKVEKEINTTVVRTFNYETMFSRLLLETTTTTKKTVK